MKIYEYHDVNQRGKIERVNYSTTDEMGKMVSKYANVYLPYGYDKADLEKKYNILYIMHGGGGSPDAWLDCCKIKNMLDYTMYTKEISEMIVVFPSYYKVPREGAPIMETERKAALLFQNELIDDLLPMVESIYKTYADHATGEGFRKSRMHRGFCGFSMGAANTWYTFLHCLDSFAWFVPLSGDCWEVEGRGGETCPEATAKVLYEKAAASGYLPDEFFIFTATGTEDKAEKALTLQLKAMKKYQDTFIYDEDYEKGNLHYLLYEGWGHEYEAVYQYLYNFLPYLFRK